MENIGKMLSEVRRYIDKDLQIRKEKIKRGEYFNIFEVLGLSSNEARTHSAFIAELLNPQGSHGCGYVFLKDFAARFLQKSFTAEELEKAKVDVEKSIGFKNDDASEGGRIDILIIIGKTMIIIENKIYAQDQEKQLLRYRNYAKSLINKNILTDYQLLYLTLRGNEASEVSTNGELKPGEDYKTISYSHDILSWLEHCKEKSVDKPLIRETIKQYINLIKELTNQNMENMQKEQMFAEMAKYPEAVAGIFHVGFTEFRNFLYERFCEPRFEEEAGKRELIYERQNAFSREKDSGFCFRLKEWKHAGIWIWTENTDHNYYAGISFDGETKEDDKNKVERIPILDKRPTSDWPIGLEYLPSSTNWNNSSIITAFTSGKYVKDIMEEVDKILKEVRERKIKLL